MAKRIYFKTPGTLLALAMCLLALVSAWPVAALEPLPIPDPIPGSYGLEAVKNQPAPTEGATITTPGNGASFSTSPINVNGICPNGLLVQIFNNGVMAGAVMCTNGSFRLQVSLFAGVNELVAIVYDDLGQPGPPSDVVKVTYTDTSFTAFGELVTLTSAYGRRAAPATTQLSWPLQLSGGTGPYAFNIDWGDGSKPELKSQASAGVVGIAHVYDRAGIYQLNVTATDVNGVSAFLQLIAVASGKVDEAAPDDTGGQNGTTKILWIPTLVTTALLFPAFWLGRRSQMVSLRNKMLKERDAYKQK